MPRGLVHHARLWRTSNLHMPPATLLPRNRHPPPTTAALPTAAATATYPAHAHITPTSARPRATGGDVPVLRARARLGMHKRTSNVRCRVVRRLVVRPPIATLLLGKSRVCEPGVQGRPRQRRVAYRGLTPHKGTPGMARPQPKPHVRTLLVQHHTAAGSVQGRSILPAAVADESSTHHRNGRHLRRQPDCPSVHVAVHNPTRPVVAATDPDDGRNPG